MKPNTITIERSVLAEVEQRMSLPQGVLLAEVHLVKSIRIAGFFAARFKQLVQQGPGMDLEKFLRTEQQLEIANRAVSQARQRMRQIWEEAASALAKGESCQ